MLPPRITAVGGRGYRDITERGLGDQPAPGAGLAIHEMTTTMSDGGVVVSVTMAEVVLRKVVYADGRFHVQIEEARDRIAFAGSEGRASLTYGAETVSFVPGTDPGVVERARDVVASAKVVETFRRLVERLGRTRRTSASSVSVRLTAALVAEVAGEPGIAVELASLKAVPIPQYPALYEPGDAFDDRWAEHARHLVSSSRRLDIEGATSPHASSLGVAFQMLLQLEAAWYATTASAGDSSGRALR
jgi:hypothetical protein